MLGLGVCRISTGYAMLSQIELRHRYGNYVYPKLWRGLRREDR